MSAERTRGTKNTCHAANPKLRPRSHFRKRKKNLVDTQTQNSHLLPIVLDGRHGVERPVVQDVLYLVENRVLREKDLGHLFDLETLRGQTVTVGIVSSNAVQIRLTEEASLLCSRTLHMHS